MGLTTDPNDPLLTHGVDPVDEPGPGIAPVYLVLPQEELDRGFVRPVRRSYLHETCGTVTTMGVALAETYARQPDFYGATLCVNCRQHRPVGADGEFRWVNDDGSDIPGLPKVGT